MLALTFGHNEINCFLALYDKFLLNIRALILNDAKFRETLRFKQNMTFVPSDKPSYYKLCSYKRKYTLVSI